MATLTVSAVVEAGVAQNLVAAAAGGDQFANTGKEIFIIENAHATLPRTVTFDVPNTDNFGVSGSGLDRAVVVAALTTLFIGPFPTGKFNDANKNVQVTYTDAAADLTVQVIQLSAVR